MQTQVDEIADGIYRFATEPQPGFTFNQFLVTGEEPLLFHLGLRGIFPAVSEAVSRVVPLDRLRWLSYGHVEADECGSLNQWLAAAPKADVTHGALGVMVQLADLADRPPRALEDDEVIDLGGRRVRWIPTPHVPHGWDAGVFFEETTATLLCGDLLTQMGGGPALTEDDLLEPAFAAEDAFGATVLSPKTAPTIRGLAELRPRTLAVMHGSSFAGDGAAALRNLADGYEQRFTEASAATG